MNTEYEVTVLDIDKKKLENKLVEIGAEKIGDFFQRRYVYRFDPNVSEKWIRLRTNGSKTTLAIKTIENKDIIGGLKEVEVEVSDFDKMHLIIQEMGYDYHIYQENKRTTYKLNDIEIDIDTWPLIPTYVEIEAKDEKTVLDTVKLLDLQDKIKTTKPLESIYLDYYGIDMKKLPREICFKEDK